METAYYNEHSPDKAAWLRELIKSNLIAPGEVDERSIEDVVPNELAGFSQCHFFAGIGVWSYALRLSGWPDDRPIWTASCPCQPFSSAGKGAGFDDERHLWPALHWLIDQCRPVKIIGEQVASKDGLAWLDLVQADLEGAGYASGAVDTCAAGFGAPHIRQRLYWMADASSPTSKRNSGSIFREKTEISRARELNGNLPVGHCDGSAAIRMAYPQGSRSRTGLCDCESTGKRWSVVTDSSGNGRLDNPIETGLEGYRGNKAEDGSKNGIRPTSGSVATTGDVVRPSPTNGFWQDPDWLFCRDGKWRPVESGTFPLAHGVAGRVGLLRGYGDCIVAPQAAEFIKAVMAI